MSFRAILTMLLGTVALVSTTALVVTLVHSIDTTKREAARPRTTFIPPTAPLDAAQIATGKLPIERMPAEVTQAIELQSEEIVKTAEALEGKQARITGTCAPGSAIRIIGEDGKVSCQRLPRGVLSVTALSGIPLLDGTRTQPGNVEGGVGRFQASGDPDFLVVPIALPDGVQVTGFSYVFYDASEEIDGAAWLYRSDSEELATVSTKGAAPQVREVETEHIKLGKVDAGRYAYFVYFQISTEAGAKLMPISASVTYRLP